MLLINSEQMVVAGHKQELISTFHQIPKRKGCLELEMNCQSSATALALFVSALYEVLRDKKIDSPVKVYVKQEGPLRIGDFEKEFSRVLSKEQNELVGISVGKPNKFVFGMQIILQQSKLKNIPTNSPYSVSASSASSATIEPMDLETPSKNKSAGYNSSLFANALTLFCSCFSKYSRLREESEKPFIGNPK
ncbi:MAG: hypothetical protein K0R66_837 [Gammaproteobacteria bacterium]|jgi:hypothetical protein|nr:hypothetical protein [Gammaproteobacteria bacterium]